MQRRMRRGKDPGRDTAARKEHSHERIRAAAARLLRRDGLRGASVRKVMAAAGLTGGGFYAHFRSKDTLFADAFSCAIRDKRKRLAGTLGDARGPSYIDRFLRAYLTAEHRDNLQDSCPYAALLSELPRAGRTVRSRVREDFAAGVKAFADRLDGSRAGGVPAQGHAGLVPLLRGARDVQDAWRLPGGGRAAAGRVCCVEVLEDVMKKRVVVTGMGVVSPLGVGYDLMWQRLMEGKSGIRAIDRFPASELASRVAGLVPYGSGPGSWISRTVSPPVKQSAMTRSSCTRRRRRRRRLLMPAMLPKTPGKRNEWESSSERGSEAFRPLRKGRWISQPAVTRGFPRISSPRSSPTSQADRLRSPTDSGVQTSPS